MNKRRIFINIDLFIFDGVVILVQVKLCVIVMGVCVGVIVVTIAIGTVSTVVYSTHSGMMYDMNIQSITFYIHLHLMFT